MRSAALKQIANSPSQRASLKLVTNENWEAMQQRLIESTGENHKATHEDNVLDFGDYAEQLGLDGFA